MGLHLGVVPLHRERQPVDQPFLHQKVQVAVYGAQAQVGVGGLQLLVDPLRGGVAVGAANCIQDSLTLFAVTDCALDNNPSLTIVIIIYNKIIT